MRSTATLLLILLTAVAMGAAVDKSVSDDAIYDVVRRRLANDVDVQGGALDVNVEKGVVTLRGKVRTTKARDKAERITKKVDGVKKVVNELRVGP